MSKIVNKDREATVLVAKCKETNKPFGIRVEKKEDEKWHETWAFKIAEEAARREKYKEIKIAEGVFQLDPEFPGCPYCGSKRWFICSCGKIMCWNGEPELVCAWCNKKVEIKTATKIDVSGDGF